MGVTLSKNQNIPPFPIFHMLFTKQQAKHSFIIPTGKKFMTTTDIISFLCKNQKKIKKNNESHAHTIRHLEVCNLYALATLPNTVHRNQTGWGRGGGGRLNTLRQTCVRLPVTSQRVLETRGLYFLCSATVETQDLGFFFSKMDVELP